MDVILQTGSSWRRRQNNIHIIDLYWHTTWMTWYKDDMMGGMGNMGNYGRHDGCGRHGRYGRHDGWHGVAVAWAAWTTWIWMARLMSFKF
jgi:hypothetical protein